MLEMDARHVRKLWDFYTHIHRQDILTRNTQARPSDSQYLLARWSTYLETSHRQPIAAPQSLPNLPPILSLQKPPTSRLTKHPLQAHPAASPSGKKSSRATRPTQTPRTTPARQNAPPFLKTTTSVFTTRRRPHALLPYKPPTARPKPT